MKLLAKVSGAPVPRAEKLRGLSPRHVQEARRRAAGLLVAAMHAQQMRSLHLMPALSRDEDERQQTMLDSARLALFAPAPGGGSGAGHVHARLDIGRVEVPSPRRRLPTRDGSRVSPRRYVPPHFPHLTPRAGGTPAAALRPPLTPRTVRERRLGGLPSLQPSPRVLLVGQRAALNKSQCEREAEAEAARTAARKGRARVRGGNLMVGFFTAR